jgi:hypothetical protein
MRLADLPSLCVAIAIGVVGDIVAKIAGTDVEDDLDEALDCE